MMLLWRKISAIIKVFAFGLLILSGFLNAIDKFFVVVALGLSLATGGVNSWISYRETKRKHQLLEAITSGLFVCVAVIVLLMRITTP